jgi:hypothetical protein
MAASFWIATGIFAWTAVKLIGDGTLGDWWNKLTYGIA